MVDYTGLLPSVPRSLPYFTGRGGVFSVVMVELLRLRRGKKTLPAF